MSNNRSKVLNKLILSGLLIALSIIYLTYEDNIGHALGEFIIYLILVVWLFIISPLKQKQKYGRRPRANGEVMDVFQNERGHSDAVYIWVEFMYDNQLFKLEEEFSAEEKYPKIGDKIEVSINTADILNSEIVKPSESILGKILIALIFLAIIGFRFFFKIFDSF